MQKRLFYYYLQILNYIMTSNISIEDFLLLSVIGKGSYAKVLLVRYKKDDQIYAMKVLKKKYIAELKLQQNIMTQKAVLAALNNPFLVKLYFTFQDAKKLYFVLEYCPGGQLYGLLQVKNKISQQPCKFYASQMLLAIQALHQKNIIYRDLKPQNILLDKKGYIKLTDFGLSKIIDRNKETMTICGTPQYLAPEILNQQGHGKPVDWWCLGCIIYQMITGFPPFSTQNRNQLFDLIRYGDVQYPNNISPKLRNLLQGLLIKNPKQRLGSKGTQQIKSHAWFDKISWSTLEQKVIKAPFLPILKSDIDIANFDVAFTSCQIESYQQTGSMTQNQNYYGFSFQGQDRFDD